jgi:hypothetical protein
MIDLETERRSLVRADRDIADGERRIERQVSLIGQMRLDGHDVSDALALLALLRDTLETWRSHRSEIVRSIVRLEADARS